MSTILDLAAFKKTFDPLFAEVITRKIEAASTYSKDPYVAALIGYVKNLALGGGKRIRPYAAYLMYKSKIGDTKELAVERASDAEILTLLTAIELFHVFALIHDDIIDRGSLRHGIPTLQEYAKTLREGRTLEDSRVAESQALLMGDLVFSWSREILLETLPAQYRYAVEEIFNAMVYAVVVGQMLDVKMVGEKKVLLSAIEEKTLLKTAQYTFIYPFRFGAALAGQAKSDDVFCERMGTALGMAFQLQDDLLDIVGSEKETGKKSLQDISEGQHTVFTAYVETHGSEEDKRTLATCFGCPCSEENTQKIKEVFERSGALAHGRALIQKELTLAQDILNEADFMEEIKNAWQKLLQKMNGRMI